jgi:hypothetical protein
MISINEIPAFNFDKIKSELSDFGVYLMGTKAKLPIKYITGAKIIDGNLVVRQLTERDGKDKFMVNWDSSVVENLVIIPGGSLMAKPSFSDNFCDVYDWVYENALTE